MRISIHSLAALALVLSAPIADAYQPLNNPSLPFQTPFYNRLRSNKPTSVTKLRDRLIHLIWGPPPSSKDSAGGCLGAPKDTLPAAAAPQSLLARYGSDVVLRFTINSTEEAQALADATETLFLDVWEHTPEWADIRLSKDTIHTLLGLLPSSLQHAHTPLMHNLAQAIHESFPSPAFTDPSTAARDHARSFTSSLSVNPQQNNVFFGDYQPLSVIHPWMRLLQSLFPTHVRLISLGTSYEGRDILALRVGVHPANLDKLGAPRKTVLVTGGVHAREWISTASVSYAAYRLITAYGKDQALTKLMEEFDFIFVPTLNPDGYVYSWETDRLWRKNRQDTSLRFCRGMDLDRSFSYQWDGLATAGNPCSESYAGERPLEALESRRLVDWVREETNSGRVVIVAFLDLHSYSQQVLYPFAYSCIATPPTLENLEEVGLGLAKAIRLADGVAYDVTSACEGSVLADARIRDRARVESLGGSALDFMYHEAGVRHAYQIKLRDRGSYGFLLPAKHIVPVGKEVFGAVEFLGKFLLGNKGIERGFEESPSGRPAEDYFIKMKGEVDEQEVFEEEAYDYNEDWDVYDGVDLEL